MDEKEPNRGDADAVTGVGSIGEAEGIVGFLHEPNCGPCWPTLFVRN